MASSLTGLVGSYLYRQRIRQDSLSAEKLATTVAPLFQSARSSALNELLEKNARELDGRLLLVDNDGKVQYDTFSALCGVRLQLPEVLAVLTQGKGTSCGIHVLPENGSDAVPGDPGSYVVYAASSLIGTRGQLGALLLVSPVTELAQSLDQIQRQMLSLFVLIAAAVLIAALLLSGLITRPIRAMTNTIRKMGAGDLSQRVTIRTSGEMRTLAESYNTMAEQLEQMDQSRNQFVSNASHELKTPMATMKILLESMLYQPDMPEEMRTEFMQDMNHEIDRLSGIVTDLLTLTQTDNHALQLHPEKFDLHDMALETLRMLEKSAQQHGHTLEHHLARNCPAVLDRSKTVQILYNLTENAIKYTPDGGHIAVSLTKEGKNYVFRVADDGIGIPEEDQSRIFDRFYRVDKARSRATGGTGLGLSIVKQMVTLQQGTITVDSTPGEGTVFTVRLPQEAKEEKA